MSKRKHFLVRNAVRRGAGGFSLLAKHLLTGPNNRHTTNGVCRLYRNHNQECRENQQAKAIKAASSDCRSHTKVQTLHSGTARNWPMLNSKYV